MQDYIVMSFPFNMVVNSVVSQVGLYLISRARCLSHKSIFFLHNWHGKEARWIPPKQKKKNKNMELHRLVLYWDCLILYDI